MDSMKHETPSNPIRVNFVCTGNICRSPMAEAVFQRLVDDAGLHAHFAIVSSGTGAWHEGERPHPGTQAILQRHGIALRPDKRAQQFRRADLEVYDYIIVANHEHADEIRQLGTPARGELRRLLEFAPNPATLNVPDPYYDGSFDYVYNLVLAGCSGLLAYIREQHSL